MIKYLALFKVVKKIKQLHVLVHHEHYAMHTKVVEKKDNSLIQLILLR